MRRFATLEEALREGFRVYDSTEDDFIVARWIETGASAEFALAPRPPLPPLIQSAIESMKDILRKGFPFR